MFLNDSNTLIVLTKDMLYDTNTYELIFYEAD